MKKLIRLVIMVVPLLMHAQNSSTNSIVTKVYKEAKSEPFIGQDKDTVMTTVQYFDALGRLQQTTAFEAGGNSVRSNGIPIDWTVNSTGTSFYNRNGSSTENKIVQGITPFGGTDLLWECKPDASNNADGGWNTDSFTIDNTKTYRYSVWVKRTGSQNGNTYSGTRNVTNLNGSVNDNPYFWAGDLPALNKWYLIVGVIHPHTFAANPFGYDTGLSGVYDTSGKKVLDGTEFKWKSNSTTTILRNYLYYSTDTSVRQYFWSPLFQEVDGKELSVLDIVNRESILTSEQTIEDITSLVEYDGFGRPIKEYLPYPGDLRNTALSSESPGDAVNTYYKYKYPKDFAGVDIPQVNAYSEKRYDNSPSNRVVLQGAPGKDWGLSLGGLIGSPIGGTAISAGHPIWFSHKGNIDNEVKMYYVTTDVSSTTSTKTYIPTLEGGSLWYKKDELYKTVTKDENWRPESGNDHTTEEFKNKKGQVLLKRTYNNGQKHDTYYVYDSFGNLTYVLPPKAEANTIKPSTVKLNELCYQYVYDNRNRLVEKKIPGKGWEYIVYDRLDRPVLTQDAKQRSKLTKEWLFTKYDALNRVVYTGLYKHNSTRNIVQSMVNNHNTLHEEKGNYLYHYTNNAFPNTISYLDIYTINYYDDYDHWKHGLSVPNTIYGTSSTYNTKSLLTGVKTKVLGVSGEVWIMQTIGYDSKGRQVYTASKNEYLKTTDIVESKLHELTGKVLETRTTHTKTGKDPITTVDRFEYDHMDRLLTQNQEINKQVSERIVKNNYDDLGQLASKVLGNGTRAGYKDITSGISISNNEITKTGGVGWSHGLATQGTINGDGYVEFIATNAKDKYYMVGLSSDNTNASFVSIDFAIYVRHSNRVYIYESGIGKGFRNTYVPGDVFRVERIGDMIYYKKNNITFYVSETKSSGSLLGDISMHTNGAKIKDFKIVDNSKGLQKVDYAYNVRGWLKNINEDTSNDNDLFNFTIRYNDTDVEVGKRLYNGNISQTSWQTQNVDNSRKTYTYTYDALNRITAAIDNTGRYNLQNVTYDKMGNILTLQRKGHLNTGATSFGTMDNLIYTYDSGNKLLKVTDTGNKTYGFKDGANSGNDFSFDANGNQIKDLNKGVTSVLYNHLNMPTEIKFNNSNTKKINYTYTADGTKIRKITNDNGSITTTDYNGEYVYENNTLKQITQPEGYLEPNGSSWKYVYRYTDFWGNTRLSYADDNNDGVISQSEIRREQNYYPGGLEHKGYNTVLRGVKNNLKTYQKQEFTEDLGLNTHEWRYRVSDPATLRFWQVDPLAEDYMYNSTFAFQENKLGMGIELEGLELYPINSTEMFNFKGGGKPVLTFGLHNVVLPTVERSEGGGVGSFVANVAGNIWNGIATSWNEGMQGKTLTEMTVEGVRGMEEMADRVTSGEGNIQDAESIVALALVRKVKGKVNGNSKSSTKPQHGYEITNETKGTRHKVGVSGGALNKNGTSRRANSQVNKLNKKGGDKYKATVKVKNVQGRQNILNWEQKEVNQHYKKTGTTPEGQKRPKPEDN